MPFDELIDAVVTAVIVTLLSARRRSGGTSPAPRRPAAGRRDTACPRCAAPACPAVIPADQADRTDQADRADRADRTDRTILASPAVPAPLAASADDFGATVMWRYPEGVRPVSAFDPKAFLSGMPALEGAEGKDPSTGSPAGRNRPSTTTRPAGHR